MYKWIRFLCDEIFGDADMKWHKTEGVFCNVGSIVYFMSWFNVPYVWLNLFDVGAPWATWQALESIFDRDAETFQTWSAATRELIFQSSLLFVTEYKSVSPHIVPPKMKML